MDPQGKFAPPKQPSFGGFGDDRKALEADFSNVMDGIEKAVAKARLPANFESAPAHDKAAAD